MTEDALIYTHGFAVWVKRILFLPPHHDLTKRTGGVEPHNMGTACVTHASEKRIP